jgi:hypothetical protein
MTSASRKKGHSSFLMSVPLAHRADWIRTSDFLTPWPHSANEEPSNRQQFLHSEPDFQLLKLPFEARLGALQLAKTLEPVIDFGSPSV